MSQQYVSIILATRNRAADLQATLRSLSAVRIPEGWGVELEMVDNGSTDETASVMKEFEFANGIQKRCLYESAPGKSRALNCALRNARGDLFLFSDDDIRFPVDWIESMSAPLLRGEADVVQGGIRLAPHLVQQIGSRHFLYPVLTSTAHMGPRELKVGLVGANMAFTRNVYRTVGAFDEDLGPGALGMGEETLYSLQAMTAGFKKAVCLQVEVEHHFDDRRLSNAYILDLAAKKGRSNAFIDYHWRHRQPNGARNELRLIRLKNRVRTAMTPAARAKRGLTVPAWKYSYTASIAYCEQMLADARKPRKSLVSLTV